MRQTPSLAGLAVTLVIVALMRPLFIVPDSAGHLAYLRSAFFDGDFHFANEFAHWNVQVAFAPVTEKEYVGNPFPVGSAALWLPFYGLAHILSLAYWQVLPDEFVPDGYSLLYLSLPAFGSACYGAAALVLSCRLAARWAAPRNAIVATVAVALGTPFAFYWLYAGSVSHVLSAFTVALFLYSWLEWRDAPSRRRLLLMGCAGGLAALVRWQDAVWLVLPATELLVRRRGLLDLALLFGIAAVVFSPQSAVWHAIYGFWIGVPQGMDSIRLLDPSVAPLLFSSHHGLFVYHPLTIICSVGVLVLTIRNPTPGWLLLLGLALEVWVSSIHHWSGGYAFGARRLVACTPVFTIGLAGALQAASLRDDEQRARRRGDANGAREPMWFVVVAGAAGGCVAYAVVLLVAMLGGRLPGEAYVSLRDLVAVSGEVVGTLRDSVRAALSGPTLLAALPGVLFVWIIGVFGYSEPRVRAVAPWVVVGWATFTAVGIWLVSLRPLGARSLLPLEERQALALIERESMAVNANPARDPERTNAVARAHHALGQWNAAEQLHRSVLAASPLDLNALMGLGVCQLHSDPSGRDAEQTFRRVVAEHPRLASGWHHLGLTFERQGRLREASLAHQSSIAYDPGNPAFRVAAARVYRASVQLQDASRELDVARAIESRHPAFTDVSAHAPR